MLFLYELLLSLIFLTVLTTESFVLKGLIFRLKSYHGNNDVIQTTSTDILSEISVQKTSDDDFGGVFVTQKNRIVLESMLAKDANITEKAREYLNYCDESFNVVISTRMEETQNSTEKQILGKIRYEVNMARRNRLVEADKMLREILSAGGLKQMEGKLYAYLRRGEIDMAFMVILQLNIEDAIAANVVTAVQVMKHLATLITEYQDKLMSPPVLLLRLLIRENDSNVRKQMLRQKLLVGPNLSRAGQAPAATPSPQCEHIVVQAVESWGGPDVTIKEIQDTITDIISQMQGGEDDIRQEIEEKSTVLRREVEEIVAELESGVVASDQCDKHSSEQLFMTSMPHDALESVDVSTSVEMPQEACCSGHENTQCDDKKQGISDEEVTLL